ncbi:MAG: TolC family protein [Treponema sp.]|jgi:outer membrane protein TolC|nr:TolC family protein [Treponema sp.]
MKRTIFFLAIILFAYKGFGEETINLEQVRTLALANSRNLAKSNLAILSTLLDERTRLYSDLPSLSLGAGASVTLWNAGANPPIENPFDTFSANMSFGISQSIFEGGRSRIQKAIYAIASESARKDALTEYFNILDSADNAYYAVLEAAATLEAEESSLQTALAGLAIAEIRQAGGIINRGDYLKALADKETRENSRNQARRNLALCITKLRSLTGLSSIPVSVVQIDFSGYEALMLRLGNISDEDADYLYGEFWKLLVQANPSLAKAGLASQRAEKNLNMEKLRFSPSLTASFSTGLNLPPDDIKMSAGRVSLSLRIPIDFWVLSNNVEKSTIARDSAVLDFISTESQLETELQSALLNIFANAGSALSSQRSLEYAERHFEFVMERYRLSQSSVSDLGEASTLLINSRNNLTRARYGFLQSLSRLRSLGAIDDEERLLKILMVHDIIK